MARGGEVGVEKTFTQASVLLPAHGAEPVIGIKKIKEYWWPKDAPAAKILQLDISVDQDRRRWMLCVCARQEMSRGRPWTMAS
jgi:hypothetical protein